MINCVLTLNNNISTNNKLTYKTHYILRSKSNKYFFMKCIPTRLSERVRKWSTYSTACGGKTILLINSVKHRSAGDSLEFMERITLKLIKLNGIICIGSKDNNLKCQSSPLMKVLLLISWTKKYCDKHQELSSWYNHNLKKNAALI